MTASRWDRRRYSLTRSVSDGRVIDAGAGAQDTAVFLASRSAYTFAATPEEASHSSGTFLWATYSLGTLYNVESSSSSATR